MTALPERLFNALQSPPPWLWLSGRLLWQRIGTASLRRFPLEVLQQLFLWLVRPWRWSRRRLKGLPALPWHLALQACWLNSYGPAEVAWWCALGVRNWNQLAQHTPDNLVGAIHMTRRRHWPDQCRPALQLLANKAALLDCTPERWRAPFLVLQPQPCSHQPNGISDGHQRIPDWWWQALAAEGVVLKPQRGHAGRGVIRFWWTGSTLEQEALFRRMPASAACAAFAEPPEPAQLLDHWHRLCRSREPALAAPYLSHSPVLPPAEPSVVVRVITVRATPLSPVTVREAWLEVPLGEGCVAFISPQGRSLPNPGILLSEAQQSHLDAWTQLLEGGVTPSVHACLEAAMAMHGQLPPIDQVAWDWIPASPQPLLLEGNGGFGLLVPQLFAHLNAAAVRS